MIPPRLCKCALMLWGLTTLSWLLWADANGHLPLGDPDGNVRDSITSEIDMLMKPQLDAMLDWQPVFREFNTDLEFPVGGEIYELKPMVIQPRLTFQQRVDRDLHEDPIRFLTPKGLTEAYLADLPSWDVDFLNRFTLPFFGMSPATRAEMRARNMRNAKHLETVRLILSVKREFHPQEYHEQLEMYRKSMR